MPGKHSVPFTAFTSFRQLTIFLNAPSWTRTDASRAYRGPTVMSSEIFGKYYCRTSGFIPTNASAGRCLITQVPTVAREPGRKVINLTYSYQAQGSTNQSRQSLGYIHATERASRRSGLQNRNVPI